MFNRTCASISSSLYKVFTRRVIEVLVSRFSVAVVLKNNFLMQKLALTFGFFVLFLFIGWRAMALPVMPIYYNTSSANVLLNMLGTVATNGSGNAVLIVATGIDGNKLNRCTAVAVDGLNGRLFLIDGAANAIWSVNLDGSNLVRVRSGLTNFPTDLALDVLNQEIYYTTSSTLQSSNTVQRMDYTGNNNTLLFTATGPLANGGNGVSRCTAIAVDLLNSKIFIADAGAQKIWSMSLAGTGLAALATAPNSIPLGLALDVTNQQVYFAVGSPVQSSNLIERVNYNGSGLTTLFTASGGVQRCTALALDVSHAVIYLSDAGVNTLWRIPLGGGNATTVLSGLPAAARKVRWFGGPATRPPPTIDGFSLSGTNVLLNVTNGYIGGTYYLLTSTNVATPLSLWSPVSTNVLDASGNFSLAVTNGRAANVPRQFYILRVQ
jgi:hypothetical protein